MEVARKIYNQFGARKLAIVGGSGLAALVAVGLLVSQARGHGQMAFLYTDLDPSSAQLITEKLKSQGVDYQLSPDGTAVQVPAEKAAELRMSLASEQIGGKVGYEVLDNEQPFGTSESRQKIDETRAIEGELVKSIKTLERVRDARVHIVMPERELFSDEKREATASITVKTEGRLAGGQVDAIRYLVSSAVPELSPDRISIVDQNGTLLARAGDGSLSGGMLDERRTQMENQMRENVETMIGRIVGDGGVRAQVAVDLNSEQTKEESETFDPDKQVVQKETSVESNDQSSEQSSTGDTTVSTSLPENQGQNAQPGDNNNRKQNETSEEKQYQNSSVHKTLVNNGGDVRRLTVSVMVDGSYAPGAGGKPVYTPRTPQEIDRLTRLVQNAVGYDQSRGDSVVVENMQFKAADDASADDEGFFKSLKPMDHLPTIVLGLLALVAMVFIAIQTRRKKGVPVVEGQVVDTPLLDPASVDPASLTPEMRALLAGAAAGDENAMREFARHQLSDAQTLSDGVDVAHASGEIKANVLKRVGEVVSESAPEAAAVVRSWMNA